MDSDGAHNTQVTAANSKDYDPVWSPDGTQIAFVRGSSDDQAIWIMNVDGSIAHQLAPVKGLSPDLTWSPDGQAVAFISALSGYNELYIINADGSDLHQAAPAQAADLDFAWSPDGKQLLVESNLTGGKLSVLMLIDVATKTRTTIVDDAYCDGTPAWMPNLGTLK